MVWNKFGFKFSFFHLCFVDVLMLFYLLLKFSFLSLVFR
jgi:hypothetical protein